MNGSLAMRRSVAASVLAAAAAACAAVPAAAQDANFILPVTEVEEHLRSMEFRILQWRGSRSLEDRTQRVVLGFADSSTIAVKWANSAPGGGAFNNEPRYEAAAYEFQKLFLEPDEYVVPPTVIRAFPVAYVAEQMPGATATFRDAESVVVVLQYWLSQVTRENFWDARRAGEDSLYARHVGNFNALTYLIRHNDANIGNFLISQYAGNPRVFSVDNGVAFNAPSSDRGTDWRNLHVRRLSPRTVQRLRAITRADLERALGTVAEFEIRDGALVAVTPGENLGPNRGVRRSGSRVQFGLTRAEIGGIEARLRNLLNQVDRGRITEL
jgi:hypothetical protein